MIRLFCDLCAKETQENYAGERMLLGLGEWRVELLVMAPKGLKVCCEDCLFEIIRKGVPLPTTRSN